MNKRKRSRGFSLLEMLLVMSVVSILIVMSTNFMGQKAEQTRIDNASLQIQQILNAAVTYYTTNNNVWPESLNCLKGLGGCTATGSTSVYLPATLVNDAWGQPYAMFTSSAPPLVYVWSATVAGASKRGALDASIIAGNLPLAYTTPTPPAAPVPTGPPPISAGACALAPATAKCYVVAAVGPPPSTAAGTPPNPGSVNFAGLYHHGGCIPVPTCTTAPNTVPQVIVVPVSVSGVNDVNNPNNVYPLASFTAYATGPNVNSPPDCVNTSSYNVGSSTNCSASPKSGSDPTNGYWRACLQLTTSHGLVGGGAGATDWGQAVTMMAITRCTTPAATPESGGSTFAVFSN